MYCRIPPPVTEAEDNTNTEDTVADSSEKADSSSQLKRPSVVSQKLWERFQTVAKKTDEVTRRSTEKRIKDLQKSILCKVTEEISHPDDLEILCQHDVKFGPPVRNEKKTSSKETVLADLDNDLSQSNEEKWKEIKNYFHVNDHIRKTGYVKDDDKSGLAKEIDAAISRGSYEEAEKLSERLSSRDFGRKIAEAADARDYLKRKQIFVASQYLRCNKKEDKVKKKIRGFYSNVINGGKTKFRHKKSKVIIANGVQSIDANTYLDDLFEWDVFVGDDLPKYDHAMLFTRYDLYDGDPSDNRIRGLCTTGGVCNLGSKTSVVEVGDYFLTVGTATHELGHSLGAVHDGTGNAKACKSEDLFIMTKHPPIFEKSKPCSRNPWIFSNCSVEAFKSTLKDKRCVKSKSVIYNETEWNKFMLKMPGEVYDVDEQCKIFVGHKSFYCETDTKDICLLMKCADHKTGKCLPNYNYFSAARGTICGRNMWCIDGSCVAKPPK